MMMSIPLIFDYTKGQIQTLSQRHSIHRKPFKPQVTPFNFTNFNGELFFHTKGYSRSLGPIQSLRSQAALLLGHAPILALAATLPPDTHALGFSCTLLCLSTPHQAVDFFH